MKPSYPLWDARFRYVNASRTTPDYLREKYRQIREQMETERKSKIRPIRKEK